MLFRSGNGVFLRKDTFVDAVVTVSPGGLVCFNYDGTGISAQIPGFAGLAANQYNFGARTGGANDNQWIDDLRIVTQTADTQLIAPAGSTWYFNDATTADANLHGTPWTTPGYDPTTVPGWRIGTALFGNDGAGIYDGATQPFAGRGTNGFETILDRSNGRATFYFRTTFNWSGPTAGVSLIASNWVDDAIVAYLNGVEVSRIRLPDPGLGHERPRGSFRSGGLRVRTRRPHSPVRSRRWAPAPPSGSSARWSWRARSCSPPRSWYGCSVSPPMGCWRSGWQR